MTGSSRSVDSGIGMGTDAAVWNTDLPGVAAPRRGKVRDV